MVPKETAKERRASQQHFLRKTGNQQCVCVGEREREREERRMPSGGGSRPKDDDDDDGPTPFGPAMPNPSSSSSQERGKGISDVGPAVERSPVASASSSSLSVWHGWKEKGGYGRVGPQGNVVCCGRYATALLSVRPSVRIAWLLLFLAVEAARENSPAGNGAANGGRREEKGDGGNGRNGGDDE